MAVHTSINRSEIKNILNSYDIGSLKVFEGISEGIENTNYFLETTNNKFILTIFEKRVKKKDLPFYLKLMSHVKKEGLNCPVSVENLEKNKLSKLKNKFFSIFTFIEGKCLTNWNEKTCYQVGKKLAEFHLINFSFKCEKMNDYGINNWNSIYNQISSKMDLYLPGLEKKIFRELNFLQKNWPKSLPTGIIHADLFPDNVLFKENKISGIIDFYFSCSDFLIYDLSISINAWCFKNKTIQPKLLKSFIDGYESKRKITNREKKKFNIFLRGAAIRFLLTRLYDFFKEKNDLKKKNPLDFIEILNFHKNNTI